MESIAVDVEEEGRGIMHRKSRERILDKNKQEIFFKNISYPELVMETRSANLYTSCGQ